MDSTNGTFLNGERINGPVRLSTGDEVRFGSDSAQFVFIGSPKKKWIATLQRSLIGIFALFLIGFGATNILLNGSLREDLVSAKQNESVRIAALSRQLELTQSDLARAKALAEQPAPTTMKPTPEASPSPVVIEPVMPPIQPGGVVERVNLFRKMAKLGPVAENTALSGGDYAHSRYMVKNYGSVPSNVGAAAHTEDPANPWYSPAGWNAARSSDVAGPSHGMTPANWAIDEWIATPFHRLSILDPHMHQIGYSEFCEKGVCSAALNASSAPNELGRFEVPVEFPGDGSVVPMTSFSGNEWPDPLSGCPDYRDHVGLPITIQLGKWIEPKVTHHTLSKDGKELDHCVFDATTYKNEDPSESELVKTILRGDGAVVLIPRRPLEAGATYNVAITADEKTYAWSFSVAADAGPPELKNKKRKARKRTATAEG